MIFMNGRSFFFANAIARYNLGPNGGILTALNLFTTKFDQVLDLVEKRAETVEYVYPPTHPVLHIYICVCV